MTFKKSALYLHYNLKIKQMENLKKILIVLFWILVGSVIISGLGLLLVPLLIIYILYFSKNK